ncbi:MAG: glycosyltransferase family 4 protein [candidate division Zixibacteria bacterium]|jgi:glycosyltransferase involved in cell wall biosynthesis|nr:glycosyltransferase family 4 protein [candidate division Zixibacteria bacterium]
MTSSPNKKVLIVSYAFPPSAAVGVYRVIKFCKYLPQFGWDPVILTVQEAVSFSRDESLLEQLPRDLKVYRSKDASPVTWYEKKTGRGPLEPVAAPTADPSAGKTPATTPVSPSLPGRIKGYIRRSLFTPDDNVFWVPYGVSAGLKAIKQERIDVIFTTSPPASAHLVGYWLSVLTGTPLVIDFRDLWTQNAGYRQKNKPAPARLYDRFLEKRCMKRSRFIVTATEGFTDLVRGKNPYKPADRIVTITNGLDPDDFASVEFPSAKNERFTILYLGSLYGARNPFFFFEALEHFLDRRPEARDNIRVDFVGGAKGYEHATKGNRLEKIVRWLGHVPQKQALSLLWQADVLLLLLGFGETHTTVIPAKLFEYIATGRPILAFVPEGQSSALIEKYNRGLAVTSPDKDRVADFIASRYDAWVTQDGPLPSKIDLPEEFDRRAKTRHLSEVFERARQTR